MDISQENCNEDLDSLSKDIPVLSEYAKGLETHVKVVALANFCVSDHRHFWPI